MVTIVKMKADKRLAIDEGTLEQLKIYCALRKIYPLHKGIKQLIEDTNKTE